MEEIWRDVPNYEGLYQCSTWGRCRRLDMWITYKDGRKPRFWKGHLLPDNPRKDGYIFWNLSKNGVKESHNAQVWIALTFPEIVGLPFEGAEVDHINDNPADNRPENLHWLTHQQNVSKEHRIKIVTEKTSIPVNQYTKKGELVKKWSSVSEIERETGYCISHISECCNKKWDQAYDYVWRFEGDDFSYNPNIKHILQYSKSGELIKEWDCVSDIVKEYNYDDSHLRKCCRGVIKSAYGYVWKYKRQD